MSRDRIIVTDDGRERIIEAKDDSTVGKDMQDPREKKLLVDLQNGKITQDEFFKLKKKLADEKKKEKEKRRED